MGSQALLVLLAMVASCLGLAQLQNEAIKRALDALWSLRALAMISSMPLERSSHLAHILLYINHFRLETRSQVFCDFVAMSVPRNPTCTQ